MCKHKNIHYNRYIMGNCFYVQAGCLECNIAGTPVLMQSATFSKKQSLAKELARQIFLFNADNLLEIKKTDNSDQWVKGSEQ